MHAVIVSVTINDGEAAAEYLRGQVVPRIKQAPGFVTGYWVRTEDGHKGGGTMIFESADAAHAVAAQIHQDQGGATTLGSVDVGEVVESA